VRVRYDSDLDAFALSDKMAHMTAPEQSRLFIALLPDNAVRCSLAEYREDWRWQGRPARRRLRAAGKQAGYVGVSGVGKLLFGLG